MSDKNIDKDIEILKELIKNANTEDADMNNCFDGEHILSIENVLSELEKLKNENNTLIEQNARMSERHFKDMGKLKELEKYKKENNNLKLKLAEMYKARGEYDKAKSIMTKELRDVENKDKELEIWQKIAEKLVLRIVELDDTPFKYCKVKENEDCDDLSCIDCVIDWAKSEVLKDE